MENPITPWLQKASERWGCPDFSLKIKANPSDNGRTHLGQLEVGSTASRANARDRELWS